jgi:hypothetical protein
VTTLLIPVVNGILPRPGGGRCLGGFLDRENGPALEPGMNVFICPLVPADGSLYRIGVLAKILDVRRQVVELPGNEPAPFVSVLMEGLRHARWDSVQFSQGSLRVDGLQTKDFKLLRTEYPAVSGAGWIPRGGYTEFRSLADIPVTLYGTDIECNAPVQISGNLKGLVSLEAAHTIEHAMIRSLRTYGLCTARTLQNAIRQETAELTWSVEKSIRFAMPEVLGQTQAGACGNPMTNLAQFYMFQELSDQLKNGDESSFSLDKARRSVMSRLTGEMGLTTAPGIRALQGLKKGMRHDDSPLSLDLCKKVLNRFPLDPWQ